MISGMQSIIARDFDRPDCPRPMGALATAQLEPFAVTTNFRVFALNGKTLAMQCSAARQLGVGC
jgi:hypothetical protein